MSKSRNLADLLDGNGDVKASGLDNVPPSNDASALTTGTLSVDRIAAGSIAAAKLANDAKVVRSTTAPSGASDGDLWFDTANKAMKVYMEDANNFVTIASKAPTITSITGGIYVGTTSSLTISGSDFTDEPVTVNFTGSGIAEDVTVTPINDNTISVSVPSGVYNSVSHGTVVDVKVVNSEGLSSGVSQKTAVALPSGGTITTSGGYRIHTFYNSGTFTLPTTRSIDVFMIGGGGGGGASLAGGGGGGSAAVATNLSKSAASYAIVVGGGGAAGTSENSAAGNGGNSSAFGQTVTGGGGGASRYNPPSSSGGNGGGGSSDGARTGQQGTKPTAISGFTTYGGFSGGNGVGGSPNYPGGGGAGCGQNGGSPANTSSKGGYGGYGIQNDFIGTNYYWGGGGGGSTYTGGEGGGDGGAGGGGGGAANAGGVSSGGVGLNTGYEGVSCAGNNSCSRAGGNGGANTGGGGGAGAHSGYVTATNQQGIGGSGIVVIRYAL
jgi:hypothetical protein